MKNTGDKNALVTYSYNQNRHRPGVTLSKEDKDKIKYEEVQNR